MTAQEDVTPAHGADTGPAAPEETGSPAAPERTGTRPSPAGSRRSAPMLRTGPYTGVLGVLVLLLVVLGVSRSQFLTVQNFVNIAESNAVLLLVATGMTFVLLVGGIDLSVGGTIALTEIVLWKTLGTGLPLAPAVLLAVASAVAVGALVNGALVSLAGLSFLVVTIGTASLLRGVASVATHGESQSLYTHKSLVDWGARRELGLPLTVWLALGVLVVAMAVLRWTGFGRMVYAVGGNPEAARLAGLPEAGVRIAAYTICAGLAGLAATVDSAQVATASPSAGLGMELTAGAAVLLGGTSFTGGRGGLLGTALGVLFLGVLGNGLTLTGVSSFWTGVVTGAVLLAAIGLDRVRGRGTSR